MSHLRTVALAALVLVCVSPALLALPPPRDEPPPPPKAAVPSRTVFVHGPGDVNGDTLVDENDVFYLLNYLYANGPAPLGPSDVNNDQKIDALDVFVLINFLFAGGPAPLPDTNPPEIWLTDPYSEAPKVATNALYTIEFNEFMNAGTLTTETLPLRDLTTDTVVPCSLSVDPGGKIVRLVPLFPLGPGRTYALAPNYAAITDLAGNPLDSYYYADGFGRIPFTAGFSSDVTGPAVVEAFPADGASGLPTNAVFVMNFTETVADIGITDAILVDGIPVTGAYQYTTSKQAEVHLPVLAPNAAHTLVVSGLKDLAGNGMSAPFTLHFTTGDGPDTTPLTYVANVIPNQTGLPSNFHPAVRFSKPVNPLSFKLAFSSSGYVCGVVSLDPTRTFGTLAPCAPLAPGLRYLYVIAIDSHGAVPSPYRFRFESVLDASTPPAITSSTPPDGATDVPVNARIGIGTRGSVDRTSLASVALSSNGSPLPASVSASAGVVTITPGSPLSPFTTYTVAAPTLYDIAAEPYPPFSSSFTTGSSSDSTPPTIASSSPADGAIGADPAAPVVVTFSEPIAPVSATETTLPVGVIPPGTSSVAQWPGSYLVTGSQVSFTPAIPFPSGTTIFARAGSLQTPTDLAGNAMAAGSGISFTTSGPPYATRPTVISASVDSTNLQSLTIRFSEPIAAASLASTGPKPPAIAYWNGTSSRGYASLSTDRLTLRMSNVYAFGPTLLVVTDLMTGLTGNTVVPWTTMLDFGPEPAPYAMPEFRPAQGSVDVSPSTGIEVHLSYAIPSAYIPANVIVVAREEIVEGVYSVDGRFVLFTPNAPLPKGALVEIFAAGSYSSFRVEPDPSSRGAVVRGSTPVAVSDVATNARLHVRYSEPIDGASVSSTSVTLSKTGAGPVSGAPSLASPEVVAFTPSAPLDTASEYTFAIAGVKDADGGSSDPFSRTFTTGSAPDTTPPSITLVSPADTATAVATNASVRLSSPEPFDPVTGADAAVTWSDSSGPLPVRFSVGQDGKLEIVPAHPLAPASLQTISVAGLTDESGNSAPPFASTFTTGSGPDVDQPTLIGLGAVYPTPLPPNAPLDLVFGEPVDVTRLTPGFLTVTANPSNSPVPGSLSFSVDRRVVRFIPAAPWTPSSSCYVYMGTPPNTELTDIAGNPYSGWSNGSYLPIGSTNVAPVPVVDSVVPVDGAANVARNTPIQVTFHEPISPDISGTVTLTGPGGVVPADLGFVSGSVIGITPLLPLDENAGYTVNVAGVRSLLGPAMASPLSFSFMTGSDFVFP
jgi:hypothetical protein